MSNRDDAIEFYEHQASALVSTANAAIRRPGSVSIYVAGGEIATDPDVMLDNAAELLSLANYVRKS